MTAGTAEGGHRIRHYGLFASTNRAETMEAVRKLLDLAPSAAEQTSGTDPGQPLAHSCPHCGGRMVITETFVSAPLVPARSPIHYPQSPDPGDLTASSNRPTTIKSP